jgi:hypothetical protein
MKVRLGYIGCTGDISPEDMERLKPYGYQFVEREKLLVPFYRNRSFTVTNHKPEIELNSLEELAELLKAVGSCVITDNSTTPVGNGFCVDENYDGISIDVVTDYIN